jgi:hypothetical protein
MSILGFALMMLATLLTAFQVRTAGVLYIVSLWLIYRG